MEQLKDVGVTALNASVYNESASWTAVNVSSDDHFW